MHVAQSRLGIEQFGYALFGITVIELVLPIITFGYNQYATIAGGKDPGLLSKLMSSVFLLKLIHFLVLLGFLLAFFRFVSAYQIYFPLIASVSFILVFAVIETLWVQSASQSVAVSNVFVGLSRIVSLILILIFIKNSQDAILFAILSLVGNALVNVLSAVYSLRKFGLRLPDWQSMRHIFQKSQPYSVIVLLTILSERMDIFFAEHYGGLVGAGYYAGCARIGHSLMQDRKSVV